MKEITPSESAGVTKSPLYKYVTGETALRILRGSIRFTQPTAFNDPFELLPEIVTKADQPNHPINVRFDVMAPRRADVQSSLRGIPDGHVVSDVLSRDIVRCLNSTLGIVSLCKEPNSLLMWSHYADQYSGAVIEFNSDSEFFAGKIDVEYRTIRPRWHIDTYLSGDIVPFSELCVKAEQWAYEKEVRIARNLADCKDTGATHLGFPVYTMPLPTDSIACVYMGERTPVTVQRQIFDAIKDTNIALSLAAIDQEGFAFRNELIKFNVPIAGMSPMLSPRTAHIFTHLQSPLGEFARWMVEKHPISKYVNMRI